MTEIRIETRIESERGCGWRRGGGKYLVGGSLIETCGKLPFKLDRCPCCGFGIKPTRGWTWIGAAALLPAGFCRPEDSPHLTACHLCLLCEPPERAGMLWIGTQFYNCPQAFINETYRRGISRRIAQIPKGFVVGETLVLLAHREVEFTWGAEPAPGIFAAFIPTAIEYVVRGDETPAELERLVKQGCTLVKVERRHPDDSRAAGPRPQSKLAPAADLWTADGERAVDRAGDGGATTESVPEVPGRPGERTVGSGVTGPAAAGGLAV